MTKKILIGWVAIAMSLLICVNVVNGMKPELSDQEILERYMDEFYGDDCYDADIRLSGEDYIHYNFYCYDDWYGVYSIDRDYYQDRYSD